MALLHDLKIAQRRVSRHHCQWQAGLGVPHQTPSVAADRNLVEVSSFQWMQVIPRPVR
jgi:hypothetical protein